MHKQDYYQILGLNQNATEQDIKAAFIKLAFRHHPDLNPGKDNEDKFKEIYEAYTALRDKIKRFGQAEGLSLDSILYDMLEISKDASEQEVDKAISNLACQYRPILKDLGYRSITDISKDGMSKFSKVYKAYALMKQKAKRQECERPDHDAPSQVCAGDEASFDLSLEDILYEVKEFARKFGLEFDEKSVDLLGVFPLGRQVVNDAYWHAQHLLSDVLGVRIKSKVRGRRLF